MSARMRISVRVQDRELREEGYIQGARVTLWWQRPDGTASFPRYQVTDSQGLAVFLVPPAVYQVHVNAQDYKSGIEDPIGTGETLPYLVVDTMSAGTQYPVVANMTRD